MLLRAACSSFPTPRASLRPQAAAARSSVLNVTARASDTRARSNNSSSSSSRNRTTSSTMAASGATSSMATSSSSQPPPPPNDGAAIAALVADCMPKSEVGADAFLASRGPESDGRGTVVVVLDTGVDPACSGLRETPDGRPKLLDARDCTGGGDVATTVVRKAALDEESGSWTIESASGGKKLKINPSWPKNPSGEYRVGCKLLFELVPGSLRDRLAADRRRTWDERHAAAVARAEEALAAAKKGGRGKGSSSSSSSSSADDDNGDGGEKKEKASASPSPPTPTTPKKKLVAEAEAALELLAAEASNYDDAGPWVEAVVFRDEDGVWRGALDTAEAFHAPLVSSSSSSSSSPPANAAPVIEGSLETAPALASYRLERKHGVLSARSACSYALTVLDGGDVLEICVDAGAHGSHCASIAAGHEPGVPHSALDGVAPGAQVISYKIGDSRFGSMETGTGLARALALTIAEARNNPDLSFVINMSYGEATSTPDAGSFIALANEAVDVHGVHFVSSAGNAGPALGTVGAPGGTSSSIIAVGAYVSPGMAAAAHSLRSGLESSAAAPSAAADGSGSGSGTGSTTGSGSGEPLASQNYTWSSRGPTFDGDTGVVVSAPGAAVACVPLWCRSSRQLMNGTSMASPCAAGCVALLLSGVAAAVAAAERGEPGSDPRLRGVGKPSPWRVRRALEATAKPVVSAAENGGENDDNGAGPLTYGRGLVNVPAAFDYLLRDLAEGTPDARYDVRVRRVGDSSGSGRGLLIREPLDSASKTVSATVTISPRLHEDADPATEAAALEHALVLTTTQPGWISAPKSLLLPHGGRSFEVAVDTSGLAPGKVHYGEVLATDAAAPWRGPLARVPVTVVVPSGVPSFSSSSSSSSPSSSSAEESSPPSAPLGDGVARLGSLPMCPGKETRRFLAAPEGATWAVLRLKVPPSSAAAASASATTSPPPPPRNFLLRLTQHSPQTRYSDTESRSMASAVPPGGEATLACAVRGGGTVEATVAQFWSSHGGGPVEVEVAFHGVAVEGDAFSSNGGSSISLGPATPATAKIVARAPFRHERLKPSAKLTGLRWALRPKAGAAVVPYADDGSDAAFADGGKGADAGNALSSPTAPSSETMTGLARGDTLPRGRRAHALTLEYSFDASEPGEYRAGLPLLTRMLYDSPGSVDAQLLLVFDGNKKLLGVSDVYPSKVKIATKGRVTFRLRLRSRDPQVLRALSDATLSLTRALEPAVSLPVFDSHEAALRGFVASSASSSASGKKGGGNDAAAAEAEGEEGATAAGSSSSEARERTLRPGERAALFVGPLPDSKVPKDASPGSVLVGRLSLGRKAARDGGGDAPGSVLPVTVTCPPKTKKKGGGGGGDGDKDGDDDEDEEEAEIERKKNRTLADRRDEAARDAAVAFIRSLPLPGTAGDEKAAEELEAVIGEALRLHGNNNESDGSAAAAAAAAAAPSSSPHLPLLAARVKALSSLTGAARTSARLRAIADAADAVAAAVDVAALHAAAARALPDESPGARRRAKETKQAREALVEALLAKAQALAELSGGGGEGEGQQGEGEEGRNNAAAASSSSPPSAALAFAAEFDAAVEELRAWSDEKDARAARLYSLREERAGRPALALRLLDKALAAAAGEAAASATPPPTAADAAARARLLDKLGWAHCRGRARGRARAAFPNDYALF